MSTHTKWTCVRSVPTSGFTAGNKYITNERGNLIDDDGDERCKPDEYNAHLRSNRFVKVAVYVRNK